VLVNRLGLRMVKPHLGLTVPILPDDTDVGLIVANAVLLVGRFRVGIVCHPVLFAAPQQKETVVQTTTSSSDNEAKKEGKVCSQRHLFKPPKFDGTRSFKAFWAQFCNCTKYSNWSREDRLIFFRDLPKNDAANMLWDYGDEVTSSLSKLTATLKQRFGGQAFVDKHRIELRNRRRRKDETLQSFHADVRRLAALAFPDMKHKAREVMATDYFLKAMVDARVCFAGA